MLAPSYKYHYKHGQTNACDYNYVIHAHKHTYTREHKRTCTCTHTNTLTPCSQPNSTPGAGWSLRDRARKVAALWPVAWFPLQTPALSAPRQPQQVIIKEDQIKAQVFPEDILFSQPESMQVINICSLSSHQLS